MNTGRNNALRENKNIIGRVAIIEILRQTSMSSARSFHTFFPEDRYMVSSFILFIKSYSNEFKTLPHVIGLRYMIRQALKPHEKDL